MMQPIIALELFCGIGGFAAAVAGSGISIVGALDQSPAALSVYRLNFPRHLAREVDLERITAAELADFAADLWWLSPPCQPYSVRGGQKDLDDPRAQSLARLLAVFPEIPQERMPVCLALENVAGFADSRARGRLADVLTANGYVIRERLLCPTELGIPSRRPRYYLVASRNELPPAQPITAAPRPLGSFLEEELNRQPPAELLVDPETVARFGEGFRVLELADPAAYTTCFTAGYGKSLMHAGSYLQVSAGVRRFSPAEIAGLLGFPADFLFPAQMPLRKCWHLLGNSLSVFAVRKILADLLATIPD